MYGFGHGWGMGFGWLVPLLIIGVLFYLFKNKRDGSAKTAQDILDERYASGEISQKEYEAKSKVLRAKD